MSNLIDTFQWLPPARDFLPILLDAGVKSVAVLAVAGAAVACMRRRSAAARYLVCFLAVASLPVLPVLSWTLPGWRVLPAWMDLREPSSGLVSSARSIPSALSTPPAQSANPSEIPPGPRRFAAAPRAIPEIVPPEQVPGAPVQIAAAPQLPPARASLDGWRAGMLAWLAGVLLALAPVVLGVFSLHRLQRAARRETAVSWLDLLRQLLTRLSFKRRVVLLKAARRRMPMTWGVLRPKVLLPEESREWPEERRGVVLLHELAHAKRCDYLTHLVARLVCALYWFNPLVWLAARRMVAERERACDDIVLRHGAKPADYAEQVLEISAGLATGRFAGYTAIAMARPSRLESRLVAILDDKRNRAALTRGAAIATLALLAALVVPVAMLKAASSEKPAAVTAARPNTGLPAASVAERIQRLIQGAPVTTNRAAEVWEPAPGLPGGYKIRPEAAQYYYFNTDDSKFLACVILHLPARNRFYIQWEDLASPGARYYGPFEGDPFRVLASAASAPTQGPQASQPRQGKMTDPKRVDADNPLGLDDETIIRFFNTGKALQSIAMQAGFPPAPLAARRPRPASAADLYKSYINREELGKDPFGNGDLRIEYSETNGTTLIRVFSVGPDGVWDGGKPILGPDLRGDLGVEIEAGKSEVRWLAEGAVLDYLKGTHAARYLAGKGAPASLPPAPPPATDEKWKFGPVVDGLRAAVELTTANGALVLGEPIDARFHIQNAADHDIQIAGPDWRQGDEMVLEAENGGPVLNKNGRPASVNTIWYSGWSATERKMLRPGQTAVLKSSSVEFLAEDSGNQPANPVGQYASVPPGKYKVHFKIRFWDSNAQLMDWQGILETGPVLIEVKAANPQSDWGEPVKGFQVRLRAPAAVGAGEAWPRLLVDITNQGPGRFISTTNSFTWQLQVDGRWYVSKDNDSKGGVTMLLDIVPGQAWTNLPLELDSPWRVAGPEEVGTQRFGSWVTSYPDNPLMKLPPGKHSVRVAVVANSRFAGGGGPVRAVSNPVEIEAPTNAPVQPAANKPQPVSSNPPSSAGPTEGRQSDWGEPVEGVSVRLSAEGAVWDFRQQGFFKFSVRNQGRQAVAVWRTEAEGELEMDGIWYRWSQPVDAKSSMLRPGGQFDGLALSIGGGEWRKDGNFLPTDPGKHTLRFAVPAQLESGGARIRVVSNPLEVEFRWAAGATNLPETFIPGDLPEMARIEGRVVDDETGAAVTDFTPQMGMANPAKPGEITWSLNLSGRMLGNEGRFRLQGQKAGQVWRILADGYLPQMVLEHPLAGRIETSSLVVRMKRGGELRGVVVNDAGQPVPGARVAVHRAEGSSVYNVFPNMRGVGDTSATTDAAGRFVLRGVDGAAQTVVVVTSSDGQMVQPALQTALGQEMKITLPRPATLIVRYDIPGDTEQAELSLQLATQEKEMPLWSEAATRLEPTVANRGQIVLTNLTPGAYEFSRQRTLKAGDWQGWPSDRRTVVLEPGETQQVNLVRSTGQRLGGKVTGLDKTAATNGLLFVRSANQETNAMRWVGQCFDALTFGKDGLFQTALLEPGVYAVMAEVYEPEVFNGIVTSGIRLPDYVGMAKVTVTTNAAPPPVKIELRPRVDSAKRP